GIAMPHSKNSAVVKPAVLFAKSKNGVDFEALDDENVHLFFMIAAPEGEDDLHLKVLATLARSLADADFVKDLKAANRPQTILDLFSKKEEQLNLSATLDNQDKKSKTPNNEDAFIVAVTACPTGIAHTYMAEEALKETAEKLGVEIRVETNGSSGVGNRLTKEEINRADGVILAADTKVETNRFDGKKLIQRPVSDGINKSEELINQIIDGSAPVFHSESEDFELDESKAEQSLWNRTYKDLMNGVSHMLPFVVGGGILIAISFLFESLLGSDSILFTSLNEIGSASFNFLIPILAGYIAMSIADRPGLLPGMAGGLLAVNSNAGFLGGLVAGFIAGYLMVWLKKSLKSLPKSLEGLKTILIFPVLGLLFTGLLMYFAVGPVFSTINNAMLNFLENIGTANAVVLGALLGGMMAIDMGGPFNKAAYAFSIGIFTDTGDGSLMAAVMAGGMIPPLAIALATRVFPDKFNKMERQSGLSNFIMGASFITEGAIPFAASDPIRVIGSSIIGAGIAGGLTQFWNVSIPAPHGGVFVVALSNRPFMFLLALLIGSVISAFALGFWRPKVEEAK
ncbi:MAG: fructose-specific PTS transporter subunit EIIC, partial [Tetragenococcus koreensis]|nr:fructose-specific PTS transporter subunit EIIC [Tetragenococcus koreensis]